MKGLGLFQEEEESSFEIGSIFKGFLRILNQFDVVIIGQNHNIKATTGEVFIHDFISYLKASGNSQMINDLLIFIEGIFPGFKMHPQVLPMIEDSFLESVGNDGKGQSANIARIIAGYLVDDTYRTQHILKDETSNVPRRQLAAMSYALGVPVFCFDNSVTLWGLSERLESKRKKQMFGKIEDMKTKMPVEKVSQALQVERIQQNPKIASRIMLHDGYEGRHKMIVPIGRKHLSDLFGCQKIQDHFVENNYRVAVINCIQSNSNPSLDVNKSDKRYSEFELKYRSGLYQEKQLDDNNNPSVLL